MGATKNAGFNAKLQRNLGLDFATKQHKSLQKLQPVYSFVYWRVNSCLLPPFRYRGPSLGRADTASKACIINKVKIHSCSPLGSRGLPYK